MDLKNLPKPETLESAITLILQYLNDKDLAFIETEGAPAAHHGFGMALRNEWGLWHDSPLNQHFKARFGLGHADDMSDLILQGVDASVKDVEFDPAPHVERYKLHWRKAGIDPLTQERVA
jgi:hypothetical protein